VFDEHELQLAPQAAHTGIADWKYPGLHATHQAVALATQQFTSVKVPVRHEAFDARKFPEVQAEHTVADVQAEHGAVHAVQVVPDRKYPTEQAVPAAAAVHAV